MTEQRTRSITRLPAGLYYGWVVVVASLVINFVASILNPIVFSFFIGPMSRELGVGASALSWALTLRIIASGVSGPPLGVLLDRYGARWLGAAAGLVAGGALIGLAAVDGVWPIYALFALTGLAGLGGGPGGQLLTQVPIAKWFVLQRGRALSFATTGLAAGTVAAVPLSQWLLAEIGWRATSIAFGVIVIAIVMPVSIVFMRRTPEDHGLRPDGVRGALTPAESDAAAIREKDDFSVRESLRTRVMWLVLGASALSGLALTSVLVHRVHFWESVGMAPSLIAFGTVLDPLSVIFSTLIFGKAADTFPIRYLGLIGLVGFAFSIVPLIITSGQTATIIAHNLVWGLSAGGFITFSNLVWPNYFGRRSLGAIRGVVLPLSIASSAIGAPLYGYLFDSGISPAWVWLGSLGAFGVAAVLVAISRPPEARRRPSAPVPLIAV